MSEPHDAPILHEIRKPDGRVLIEPPGLPTIPGGWMVTPFRFFDRDLQLTQPADPDAFLDDEEVLRKHAVDGYMPYWSYLWPAAVNMCRALEHAPWPVGSRVLELGAGVGLVGLADLARGDQVVFTDYDPLAVDVARYNARDNGFTPEGFPLDWFNPPDERYDVIIASEVLYEVRNHQPLLNVLERMLTPNGVCWFGDAGRTRAEIFFRTLESTPFHCTLRDEHGQPLQQPRFGQYQMFELRHRPAPGG